MFLSCYLLIEYYLIFNIFVIYFNKSYVDRKATKNLIKQKIRIELKSTCDQINHVNLFEIDVYPSF